MGGRYARHLVRRAVIVGVVLALQLLVPLRALVDGSDQRQRFGWNMYSTETYYPHIVLELRDGGSRSVALGQVVRRRRPEVDYARDLPPYLCGRYPEAGSVRLTLASPEPEVTRCD